MRKLAARHKMTLGLLFAGLVLVLFGYLRMQGLVPDLEMVKMYRMDVEEYLMENLLLGVLVFAAVYAAVVALSLPFATPLTILAGFLFGNLLGTGVVALSASVGATLAFLLVRFFFREYVTAQYGRRLRAVNREFSGHGFRDILIMRLMPVIPFVLINAGAALTAVRVRDFFLATLLGVVPFTFVYVNAGRELARLRSLEDIVSFPALLGVSLLVIAVTLPLFIRRRQPKGFDTRP